jgi:acyl dehydratase
VLAGSVSGPVASRWAVPADIGRRYAALSGDRNPIHLYPLTARLFGFRRAIAHGMWVKARTLSVLEGRLPTAFVADVAFKTPVFLPSAVEQSTVRVEDGWDLGLRGLRNGKPHLVATVRGLAGSSPRDSGGG